MGNNYTKKRGLNFKIAKYRILGKKTFLPHIRKDYRTSIPIEILEKFNFNKEKEPVALIQIISENKSLIRTKKLTIEGDSLIFSLEKERHSKIKKIKVIDIKNKKELLKRTKILNKKKIETRSIIPRHILKCSLPCKRSFGRTQIYLFKYRRRIIAGNYLGSKNVIFMDKFKLDKNASSIIGLYEAEGGKICGTFTNSQPKMINQVLDFIEKISDIKRKDLTASINCNYKSALDKNKLEKFWKSNTGISTFHKKLHLTKNIKSPQGILQVFLNSKILKEFMCGMFLLVFKNQRIDKVAIIRGLLSGDGSPVKQTKTYITHHIATDKNHIRFQEKFINKIFKGVVTTIKKINDNKIVIYNNWADNLDFLFLDPYRFNIFNRLKFARNFLDLKTTKEFIKLRNGDKIKGIEIAHNIRPIKPINKAGYIRLEQISPKPNKMYKIYLTSKGKLKQIRVKQFIHNNLYKYKKDVENFNNELKSYNLI